VIASGRGHRIILRKFGTQVSNTSKQARPRLSRPHFDLLIAGSSFLAALVLCGIFDIAEAWFEFAEDHEAYELDEILIAAPLLTLGFAWFAWRRWQESKAQAQDSAEAYRRLKEELRLRAKIEKGLIKAQHEAEAADRAKSEFLANMSHELRTPLNASIGFAELIEQEVHGPVGSAAYKEYISSIRESGQHLLGIINDILDLSKIEAGKLELYEEILDLSGVARSAVRLVARQADEQGVELVVDVPETLPSILGDPRLLKQILVNLLSNAVKFSEPGARVMLDVVFAPSGACVLRVTDQGIGMAPEDVPVALQPFGQVSAAFARDYEGTGLGLPLSRALSQLHGGDLTIQSTPGQGTAVEVAIPEVRVMASETAVEQGVAFG